MIQLPYSEPRLWSVSELTQYLTDLIQSDTNLQDIWVTGEVSNISHPRSGHLYFTIKDETSSLKCVMWRNQVNRLPSMPKDGQKLEIHGGVGVYQVAGIYQLYVDLVRSGGEGLLYRKFIQLKIKLEEEGLFDPENKQQIPKWPACIGIVTSPTGAAFQDILNTLKRRYPIAKVVLAPTLVQGENAPGEIISALDRLNNFVKPDVILVVRGGGSIEDLWAFNNEDVARTITKSKAPVITGIGHETDFTIADFVSDLRAPTPTAAAELATPDRIELIISLNEQSQRLARGIQTNINNKQWALRQLDGQLTYHSPTTRLRSHRQQLDEFGYRITTNITHYLMMERTKLDGINKNLVSLNPQTVLRRGYAAVTLPDGHMVHSIYQVKPGIDLDVHVSDGQFTVEVKDQESQNE